MKENDVLDVAHIAVIMGDNNMIDKLLDIKNLGYIAATQLIASWALEFHNKYKNFDWELLYEENDEFPEKVICWDDAIIYYAHEKYKQLDNYEYK